MVRGESADPARTVQSAEAIGMRVAVRAEQCVLEARPPGTWGCGCLWGLKGGCGWLRVESGLRERSWARTQKLGAFGCCQVRGNSHQFWRV